jgi:actin-related protein
MCVRVRVQFVKCGFAGANFPEAIFPSVIGRPILRAEEKVDGVQIKVRVVCVLGVAVAAGA